MSRLIVVSNRVSAPSGRGEETVGGLAMALSAALREYTGIWFGWSGETTEHFTGALKTQTADGVTVATVDLEEADVQEYYNGYANKTLWPLFHYRVDLTQYDRSFGEGYDRVNRRFAETLAPLIREGDLIWIQDYHLIPLARKLRTLGVRNRIGFFLHIPWPAHQLVITLPRHRQLVEALFHYDLIGFQTREHLAAFQGYVVNETRGELLADGWMRCFGRKVRAGAFPIGIDADNFHQLLHTDRAVRSYDIMAAHTVFRSLILGVDRLDYSKGLEERLLGYEHFLAHNPEFRRQMLLLQIAPVSRDEVEAYQDIRARLDAMTGRINGAFGDMDWAPIRYVNKNYRRDELAGIYRAARVGLVTPLRDGMNLVAKEYVAAQNPSDPGVLILSRFAGAALQMREALIVNPYSPEELSDALKRALTMSREERIERWQGLYECVEEEDVTAWRDSYVRALSDDAEPIEAAPRPVSGPRTEGYASH